MLEPTTPKHGLELECQPLSTFQSINRELDKLSYVGNEPQTHGRGIAATPSLFILKRTDRWNAFYTVTINFAETSVSAVILVLCLPFDGQKDVMVTKTHQLQARFPLVMGLVKK